MSDLIYRQEAIDKIAHATFDVTIGGRRGFIEYKKEFEKAFVAIRDKYIEALKALPAAEPEIVRCKDCKHQEKFFHADRRRKDGGYYIYGCELTDGYSHVCLDDDFCSRAERRRP